MMQYLDGQGYWRLRYLQCDAERITAQAKLEVARALERYHEALRAAGFDPSVPYLWDDAAQTLTHPPGPNDGRRHE